MIEILQEIIKQKRRLLVIVLALVVLNAVCVLVEKNVLTPRIQASELRLTDLQRRLAAEGAADVGTLYKRGLADLATLSARIPAKRQFPRILGDVMEMAASNNLQVGKITYKPQLIKENDLLAYTLNMSVNGSYAAVKSFIVDLQSKQELLIVDSADFANEDLYEELVSLSLKVTVYLSNKEGV